MCTLTEYLPNIPRYVCHRIILHPTFLGTIPDLRCTFWAKKSTVVLVKTIASNWSMNVIGQQTRWDFTNSSDQNNSCFFGIFCICVVMCWYYQIWFQALQMTIPIHGKNKLDVLITESLPWLQTNWRESGYERYWRLRQPKSQVPSSSYNHNTLTTLRTSVKESLQIHFKVIPEACIECHYQCRLKYTAGFYPHPQATFLLPHGLGVHDLAAYALHHLYRYVCLVGIAIK